MRRGLAARFVRAQYEKPCGQISTFDNSKVSMSGFEKVNVKC